MTCRRLESADQYDLGKLLLGQNKGSYPLGRILTVKLKAA